MRILVWLFGESLISWVAKQEEKSRQVDCEIIEAVKRYLEVKAKS